MKTKHLSRILLALFALSCSALGAQVIEGVVTLGGTAATAKTNYVLFAPPEGNKAIKLTSFQAVGDNADAVITFMGAGASTRLTAAQTSTNLTVASTNLSIAVDSVIVLYDHVDGDLAWGKLHSTGTLTINLDRDPGTFSNGSYVYAMTETSLRTVGSATVTQDGYAIASSKKRTPFFMCIVTSAGTTELIKYATAEYYDPD